MVAGILRRRAMDKGFTVTPMVDLLALVDLACVRRSFRRKTLVMLRGKNDLFKILSISRNLEYLTLLTIPTLMGLIMKMGLLVAIMTCFIVMLVAQQMVNMDMLVDLNLGVILGETTGTTLGVHWEQIWASAVLGPMLGHPGRVV
ncbi:hypothetical protein GOBAR_AA07044 [Gossypium barbadense]|uniref:Uncharacterized protein n=1 Tax=Gossypium barbadense TaxID=3634 RepID=A0A2P5YD51_GOSBA|nr:hypothetical protein GOBAR_AA07044 [Gossypium barbadense]